MHEAKSGERLYAVRGWSEPPAPGGERGFVSETLFPDGATVRLRAVLTGDDPPRCLSYERVTRDAAGAVVAREERRMAPEAFPFLRRPLPADTYPPEAPLGHVLTRMGLGRRERASFHVLLGDRSVVQVDAWVDGRETIRVPAGEFEAWRIHMRPSAASLFPSLPALAVRFASFFIPRQTVWLSVAEPQRFLQFAGTMGPPGTPSLHVRLETIAAAGGGPGGGAEAP